MINVLIPISSYQEKQDVFFPKNLLEINGKPLIQNVIEVFKSKETTLNFVISKEEASKYHTDNIIKMIYPTAKIFYSEGKTKGALATCMLAIDAINNNEELIVASGDQIVNIDVLDIIEGFRNDNLDGGILAFKSFHPKWSYIQYDNKRVTYVQEKRVISNLATVGIYYFNSGMDFVEAAKEVFLENDSVNENFYVSHVYNHLILRDKIIGYYEINQKDFYKISNLNEIETYSKVGKEL